MPRHDLAERTTRRGCDIKFLRRQPTCKHLHDCLIFGNVQKLMRRTVYGGRNAPVQDAMSDTVVVERIAKVHHEDAAIDIRVMAFPASAHSRKICRNNQHLVGV